jgi:Tfp pilus assembly protein PilF
MRRSDHSMRPPAPAATLEFGSPNACTLCHADRDARWADDRVREWHERDYQKPVLERARLIAAAREGRWDSLPAMFDLLAGSERDEITAVSLVRLLDGCDDERKRPALIRLATEDPSPLVRGAAVTGLKASAVLRANPSSPMDAALRATLNATRDPRRLVRVRAAAALAGVPVAALEPADRESLAKATDEFATALRARPEDAAAHYTLGNFHLDRGELERAAVCYENALRIRDDFPEALIHSALALHALGRAAEAKVALERACRLAPCNEAAHMNRGMLLGELGETKAAEEAFRSALEANPRSSRAAFNLGICISEDHPDEGLTWLRKAAALAPGEPQYAYALAFHLQRRGEVGDAIAVLRPVIDAAAPHTDAHRLLGLLYEKQGDVGAAREVYRRAANHKGLSDSERLRFIRLLSALPDDSAN